MLTDSLNHLMMEKNTCGRKIFCLRMDGKTGESLDSDGGNDGRGNNLPESTGHTVNHEMETPLNFKMRTLERPETVTAATTAAAMTCLKTRSSDSGQLVTL